MAFDYNFPDDPTTDDEAEPLGTQSPRCQRKARNSTITAGADGTRTLLGRDGAARDNFNLTFGTWQQSPRAKGKSIFSRAPQQIRQGCMNTGAFPKNDYERVARSLFDNQRRDTAPSLRTIVGQDLKVLNLRPLNKSLHLDDAQFRNCSLKNSIERIQIQNLK